MVPELNEGLKLAEKAAVTDDLIEAEINEGAQRAAEKEEKEAVKEAISQSLGPLGDSIVAEIEHRERVEGMSKFKAEVQYQVSKLVEAARKASDRAKGSRAEAEYVEQIKQQIDQACGNPVPVTPPR